LYQYHDTGVMNVSSISIMILLTKFISISIMLHFKCIIPNTALTVPLRLQGI